MRTSTCVLLICLFLGMSGTTMAADVSDLNSVLVDPSDIQQFEQSYETWVMSLVQNVVTTQKPTVLVEMTYSKDGEKLQSYSDLKSLQHLPGLPEVLDPHLSHPSESPVSALLQSRKIKIIFEKALTSTQEKILAEVLNSKLRINARAGDALLFSTVETPAAPESGPFKNPKVQLAIMLSSLTLALWLARGRRSKESAPDLVVETASEETATAAVVATESAEPAPSTQVTQATQPPPPPFELSNQYREIIGRMKQADSQLVTKTASIVNPTQIILRSEPKTVIRTIRAQTPKTLACAIHGTSILFQKTILSACTSRQRSAIRLIQESEKITQGQANFAQHLLAAKIHRERRAQAAAVIDQLVLNRRAKKAEQILLQQARRSLAPSASDETAAGGEAPNPEVQL